MKSQPTLRPLAVLLTAVLALLLLLCGYQWTMIVTTKNALADQRVRLDTILKQVDELKQANVMASRVTKMVTQQSVNWEWSQQLPASINQLSAIEQSAGVAIDTLQPATIVTAGQLSRFPIHLSLHTTLAKLTKFLQQVQQAVPLCAVDQISIHAGKTPAELLLVDLTLSSYAIVDKTPATGGKP